MFRLFSRLFGMKEKDDEEPEGPENEENGEDEGQKDKRKRKKGRAAAGDKAAADIERLAAKLEVLSELRKTDEGRFERTSEQIGELRNLILEKEQEIKEIGTKAVKAADTVESLKPDKILAETRKSATKYELLEARIEAANALYQKVMEELRDTRKRLALFQGTEELIKLNSETRDNLANIKRMEANIESHANKTGNTFLQFQKLSSEFLKYKDAASALAEEFKNIETSFEEVKAKAQSALIDKKDLDALRKSLQKEVNERLEAAQRESLFPANPNRAEQIIPQIINGIRKMLDAKGGKSGKELADIKSVKADAESNAKGLKNAFSLLQRQQEGLKSAAEDCKRLAAEVNEMKLKMPAKATQDATSKRISWLEARLAQKKLSEQLILGTLNDLRKRLDRRDEEVRIIRNELGSHNDRLYKAIAAQARQKRELSRSASGRSTAKFDRQEKE